MTNRREFLQIGVSASAWPILSRAAHAADLGQQSPAIRITMVVYDRRFAESVAFADRSAALGLTIRPIEADMTRLWYEDIYHRWQRGPAAIAGLTTHGPMFCFAELARDVRMRVVFRVEHRVAGTGAHHVTGPIAMLDEALAACRTPRFGAPLADVVARCPEGRHEIASAGRHEEPDEDALYTWVIAPASRA